MWVLSVCDFMLWWCVYIVLRIWVCDMGCDRFVNSNCVKWNFFGVSEMIVLLKCMR